MGVVNGLKLTSPPVEFNPPIAGSSPAIGRLRELVRRLADTQASILITGESGTGKDLVARNLHWCSRRARGPFVPVNCAALNPGVLESELFGHGRGAFTGAVNAHAGLFEQAEGGTLFLDEIAEVPLFVQAKLLRVLQDREVRRMGTAQRRRVDVRIISATNTDLDVEVDEGRFRLDLFYRLKVVDLTVPPLRERVADIPILVDHFFTTRGAPAPSIHKDAFGAMARYWWPGNVRELQNELERVMAFYPRSCEITPGMLSERILTGNRGETLDVRFLYDASLPRAIGYLEEKRLRKTLAETNWNKSQSARELGLSRQGLLKKIKRYGILREEPDAGEESGKPVSCHPTDNIGQKKRL
ncbi:MAG: sigma-54-dependent Fis family transcriptional regulator [Candidatus Latescibacterota bacterium]|nr:MAG: sigma-54-dependent Fis family transcriptional regulator [Candidatus Latescibacterota bacterium]